MCPALLCLSNWNNSSNGPKWVCIRAALLGVRNDLQIFHRFGSGRAVGRTLRSGKNTAEQLQDAVEQRKKEEVEAQRQSEREQQDGGTAARSWNVSRATAEAPAALTSAFGPRKTTKPGQGRCAANGSIVLIDPPISPPRLPVGPAARCRDPSLQQEDQYRPLRPAAAAIIHFEAIDAEIKSDLFILF